MAANSSNTPLALASEQEQDCSDIREYSKAQSPKPLEYSEQLEPDQNLQHQQERSGFQNVLECKSPKTEILGQASLEDQLKKHQEDSKVPTTFPQFSNLPESTPQSSQSHHLVQEPKVLGSHETFKSQPPTPPEPSKQPGPDKKREESAMADHFNQVDYQRLQERLNSRLDDLAQELHSTLKDHVETSRNWPIFKAGWKYTIEWLKSNQRWPDIDTFAELDAETGRKVLYVNSKDYKSLNQERLNRYSYIVIKKGFPEDQLGEHLPALKERFETGTASELHIQKYVTGGEGPVFEASAADKAALRLATMIDHQKAGTAGSKPFIRDSTESKSWKYRLPWNFLNLDGGVLDPVTSSFAMHACLRFLYNLCDELKRKPSPHGFGKPYDMGAGSFFADVQSCLRFFILGERGTFSGNHLDILAGTWILCLCGIKLWWVFTGDFTEEKREAFALQGAAWNPGGGQMQLLPLEAGDYMMMMPGHLCAHAPFTMEDCFMTGGMFWNENMLPKTLENIAWICKHNGRVSNEGVPRQLVEVLTVLRNRPSVSSEILDAIDRAEAELKPLLSCGCEAGEVCGSGCACERAAGISMTESKQDEIWWRSQGCTRWCACSCRGDEHVKTAAIPQKASKKRGRATGTPSRAKKRKM